MNIEISPKEYEKYYLNWDDAIMYCQLLTIDNKNDWRMPTKEELNYMYKSKNDFVGYYYWSSTEKFNDLAWYQNMLTGLANCFYKDCSYNVRAVRSI